MQFDASAERPPHLMLPQRDRGSRQPQSIGSKITDLLTLSFPLEPLKPPFAVDQLPFARYDRRICEPTGAVEPIAVSARLPRQQADE